MDPYSSSSASPRDSSEVHPTHPDPRVNRDGDSIGARFPGCREGSIVFYFEVPGSDELMLDGSPAHQPIATDMEVRTSSVALAIGASTAGGGP
jgi:hypothetical protein